MSLRSTTQSSSADTGYCGITITVTRLFNLYAPSFLFPKISTQQGKTGTPPVTGEGSNGQNILYLAYGSNLDSKTFQGRRGVKPVSATVVTVPTLTLVFDLPGIAYLEPCFANVRDTGEVKKGKVDKENSQADRGLEDREATAALSKLKRRRYRDANGGGGGGGDEDEDEDTPSLIGVVYEVTPEDYTTIIATEGGGGSYADVLVECIPISDEPGPKPFKAHILIAPATKTRNSNAQASSRYLGLITSGAAQHDLPESYRNYLARFKPYRITTVKQEIGRVLFVGMWLPIILVMCGIAQLIRGSGGKQPGWIAKVNESVFRIMWWCYDTGFKRCFGDGEGTIQEEITLKVGEKREGSEREKKKIQDGGCL